MEAVPLTHLDTHVLAWIYRGEHGRMPQAAIDRLEEDEIAVSPMVVLELQVLFELGRVSEPAAVVLERVGPGLALRRSGASMDAVCTAAAPLRWTRDPFDRLIAGNSIADGANLLTADGTIRANLATAVWDDA